MMQRKVKEWNIDTVFGKLAVISWGDPASPPILMVHGYMDTAATFTYLQEELPDSYYYVAFDIPGHGKSDPMPGGPPPSQAAAVEALRSLVDYMGWKRFVLLGHSLGGVIGMFYSYLFPGKVSKIILIDSLFALSNYFYLTHDIQTFYGYFYEDYYYNYLMNTDSPKLFSYDKAVSITMKNRELTKEKAEVILSRSLVPVGDLYRFSTQLSVKKIGPFTIQTDMLLAIMKNQPPILSLIATKQKDFIKFETDEFNEFEDQLIRVLKKEKNTFFYFEGHHDIHVSNPEIITPLIVQFLHKDDSIVNKKSKL